MMTEKKYDLAIIGGGLGGLALAVQCAGAGMSVVVIEKETYPLHRVCGEYISMESWDFLIRLGLPLEEWRLPRISRLQLTAPSGRTFEARLPLGGFGLSRHRLDSALADRAAEAGAMLLTATRAEEVEREGDGFTIRYSGNGGASTLHARYCAGAWGKRGPLDVKWKRRFVTDSDPRLDNWAGIKYHIRCNHPENLISLHNFERGYCGLSKVEDDRYTLCYLTHADNLKKAGGVAGLERAVMARNPHLARILGACERLPGFPVAISQVSFARKGAAERGLLMLGDAAGAITPLCGNGMSMALHGSLLAARLLVEGAGQGRPQSALEGEWGRVWKARFGTRLRTGRIVQGFFGKEALSEAFVGLLRLMPGLARPIIRQTHGTSF